MRRRWRTAAVAVAALVATLGVACSGADPGRDTATSAPAPADVAAAFTEAVHDSDVEEVARLLEGATFPDADGIPATDEVVFAMASVAAEARSRWRVVEVDVTGEEATVRVAVTDGPGGMELRLVRADGTWRIVSLRAARGGLDGEVVVDVIDAGTSLRLSRDVVPAGERVVLRIENATDRHRVCELHDPGDRPASDLFTGQGVDPRLTLRAGLPPAPPGAAVDDAVPAVFDDGFRAGSMVLRCFSPGADDPAIVHGVFEVG